MISTATSASADRYSLATGISSAYPYGDPNQAQPSTTFLGPPSGMPASGGPGGNEASSMTSYYGVCLTVWSHADDERNAAIRASLESAARHRHMSSAGSAASAGATSAASGSKKPGATGSASAALAASVSAGVRKKGGNGLWSGTEGEESDATSMCMSESDAEGFALGNAAGAGASTLFLPEKTIFWLPYALSEYCDTLSTRG